MDPSRNNLPLQFNKQKNQPPMPVTRSSDGNPEDDVSSSTAAMMGGDNMNNMNSMMGQGGPGMAAVDQSNMMGGFNMMSQMVGHMQQADPNMMMMGHMNYNGFGDMMNAGNMMGGPMGMQGMVDPTALGQGMMGHTGMMMPPMPAVKEIIRLKSSVLYPPPPGAPTRSTRDRPPGCRTIFIGGLPEKITEDLLFELFESCGPIQSIRISKKNFAHIRFEMMESVERALYISGFRMKIGDSDEKEETGRLHVDYAQARDDQHEFECQQRALAREMRHIQRLEQERLRPPSPPPVTYYSDHEATVLADSLKTDEDFQKSCQVLITWLERGECNRRTSSTFYTLVQTVHGHIRRLKVEKQGVVAEYDQYKMQYELRLQGITTQISQVERVMAAAHKQKCWDHFTKAQRKNVDTWQRQAQEAREQEETEAESRKPAAVDMDMDSDDDETPVKKRKSGVQSDFAELETQNLKEENDSLKCQLEALKNEVDMARSEGQSDVESKDKQVKALQNALQGMQQQLIAQRASVAKLEFELEKAKEKVAEAEARSTQAAAEKTSETIKEASEKESSNETNNTAATTAPVTVAVSKKEESSALVSSSGLALSDKEAKILGLVCCFLHVHPNGATVDYLWSYLRQLMSVKVREVEDLLEKVPAIFDQQVIGVGAATERRWIYTAMKGSLP